MFDYHEVDAASHLEELKSMGFMAAPVVIAEDGGWSGYRPDMIDSLAGVDSLSRILNEKRPVFFLDWAFFIYQLMGVSIIVRRTGIAIDIAFIPPEVSTHG